MKKIAQANYSLLFSQYEAEGLGNIDTEMDKGTVMFQTDTKYAISVLRC